LERELDFEIAKQPDDVTCGPTCLQAVYRYHGTELPLAELIAEIPALEGGGTLGVTLGVHALRRGWRADLHTFNLVTFDPTWADLDRAELRERLLAQARFKRKKKLRVATDHYVEYLDLGGRILLGDEIGRLVRDRLDEGLPLLTGLSATYLYGTPREYGPKDDFDDVRGEPSGHFVVLVGYDRRTRRVLVADPHGPNPLSDSSIYPVGIDRLVAAILLGIVTYDANLLVVRPPED